MYCFFFLSFFCFFWSNLGIFEVFLLSPVHSDLFSRFISFVLFMLLLSFSPIIFSYSSVPAFFFFVDILSVFKLFVRILQGNPDFPTN